MRFLYMAAMHRAEAKARAAGEGTPRGCIAAPSLGDLGRPHLRWAMLTGLGSGARFLQEVKVRKIPQGGNGVHKAWQPERDLGVQGSS